MSSTADQLDSGGGITNFFDENQQERRSWRLCNSRVPQSEVVYFTQIFRIFFLIAVSLIKFFRVFSIGLRGNILVVAPLSHSWLRTSKPKAMNKIISTSDRYFMAVSGPACCCKTELFLKILLHNTFSPKFQSIFYFYQHEQPKFEYIER